MPAGRAFPSMAPPLLFDVAEAQRLYDLRGSNCGPGAIAGVCGLELESVLDVLGAEFNRRRATTEIMLTAALDACGVKWRQVDAALPSYGIARVQWDGPWINHPDPFEKLRHSHWIGCARERGTTMIFDHNAIAQGGWIGLAEWDQVLRPWLLQGCEPNATGAWWVSDAYEVSLPCAVQSSEGRISLS